MSKFDLSTEQGRTAYLIHERDKNIKEFRKILAGKHPAYKDHMNSEAFLKDVQRQLDIEIELLRQLIED